MAGYEFNLETGSILTDTQDLLEEVKQEFRDSIDQNLNLASSTLAGTMATAETARRAGAMRLNAENANQINPNLAVGVFLDAICALMGKERNTNNSTILRNILLTGEPTAVIAQGSRIQAPDGTLYASNAAATITSDGTVRVDFSSVEYGAFTVSAGALTIIDGVVGWSNTTGGAAFDSGSTLEGGAVQLTDPKLKNVRTKQLAIQGRNAPAAILGNVLEVANVKSAKVVVNNTGVTQNVNGVEFTLPTGVWCCVAGNYNEQDVAEALQAAQLAGTPWDYGTASGVAVGGPDGLTVIDPSSDVPYKVKYVKPVEYDCYVYIVVKQGSAALALQESVAAAIISYANGEIEGDDGFVVGASVSSWEIAAAVNRLVTGVYVKSCQVACVPAGSGTPVYPGDYSYEFEMPTFGIANIITTQINVSVQP